MKKIIIITLLLAASAIAMAFDNFVPAEEMFGKYFKFSSYYNKEYQEFDGGFDNFGLMIAKPHIYGNLGFELDATTKMDDVYRETFGNLSLGFNFRKRLAIALTGGIINRAYDTGGLIFNVQEDIADESIFAPTVGASFHSTLIKKKLELGGGAYYINQPDISMNNGEDKMPIMADSYLRWTINKNFMLGASYHLEDNEHYFGVDFSFSIPAPWLKFKTAVSQEKISFIPSFHTFNYWTFDVKYDYFLEKELVGTNYGVQVTYELVKEYPVIAVYNEFEGIEIVDTEVDSVLIDFGVEDADRLYFIKANLNEETQLLAGKLSEYSKKNYSVPVQLKEGKNVFDISTRAVNGKPINKQIVFNYTLPTWIAEVDSVNADSLNVKDNAQDLVVEVIEETETEPVVEEVIVVEEKQDEVQLIDKYIVKPGDSLWKIAKMPECYNDPYKWKTIYELNTDQIKNPDLIYPDQELIIRSFFKGFYIVKKGDTLWGISKKSEIYGDPLKWRKLYENNKDVIKNPDLIYPNQKLKVGDE